MVNVCEKGAVMAAWVALLVTAISALGQEAAPRNSREDVISIQIGLDDAGFSPGQIDGNWGGMTRQALAAWQQANELKPTGEFDADTAANFPAVEANYTNYVVTAADLAKITRIPEDWKARSELSNMWFETVVEMVAEKCHASEGLIKTLNPGITNWAAIRGKPIGRDAEPVACEARGGGEGAGQFVGENDHRV